MHTDRASFGNQRWILAFYFPITKTPRTPRNPSKQRRCVSSTAAAPENIDVPYSKIRVLIAKDNLVNQKVLTKTLTRLGLDLEKIDIVGDGKQAVEAAGQKLYDVIFMDMEMPVMGGIESCKLINVTKQRLFPIIVFVTAHAIASFRKKCREAGGSGFISKPSYFLHLYA